jgi:hypothetical protein
VTWGKRWLWARSLNLEEVKNWDCDCARIALRQVQVARYKLQGSSLNLGP